MSNRASIVALIALLAAATPASAIDGEVLITHPKAVAGNVTPGDTAGYPVTISLPSSYKFAGNLTVPIGKNGITVTSAYVTIDFAGFRLFSGGNAFHGITGTGNSVTIKNGTIANFKGKGIWGTGQFWSIDNMRIAVNAQEGIFASTRSWSIANSQIVENGSHGIFAAATDFLVRNNVINGNGRSGITLNAGHIEGNIVANNGDGDVSNNGVFLGSGTALGNTIINNSGLGLYANPGVGYGNNTLSGNNGDNPEVFGGGFQLHPNVCNGAAC